MDQRLQNAPCGFLRLTPEGEIQWVNETFLMMTGLTREELVGSYFESFLSIASKIMFHSFFFAQVYIDGKIEELYLTFRGKDKQDMPILLMGNVDVYEGLKGVDCVVVKTARRDQYEKELQDVKKRLEEAYTSETILRKLFETTLRSVHEGIVVTDRLGKISIFNEMAVKYTGTDRVAAIGKNVNEVFYFVDKDTNERISDVYDFMLQSQFCKDNFEEVLLIAEDKTKRYISGAMVPLSYENNQVTGYVISFRDITREYLQEKQLLNMAVKDQLTGLYNRHFLESYIEELMESARTQNKLFSLAILDLDYFKLVNDTWGHPAGDEQLKHTTKIVLTCIRHTDLLVRFGGEEFIMIFPDTTVEDAKTILNQVRMAVEENPTAIAGKQTVSIGVAQWQCEESFQELYERADEALYCAKKDGRNCVMGGF